MDLPIKDGDFPVRELLVITVMGSAGEHFWLLRTLRVPLGPEDGTETKVALCRCFFAVAMWPYLVNPIGCQWVVIPGTTGRTLLTHTYPNSKIL